jgi:hypothetical protein
MHDLTNEQILAIQHFQNIARRSQVYTDLFLSQLEEKLEEENGFACAVRE